MKELGMPRIRRLLAGLVVLAALIAPAGASAAEPAVPVLAWADCGEGFQCATATVPQDYADPTGPSYQLALVRLPATDQAHRIGSLFMNPGGPGGSGVDFLRGAAPSFAPLNERFDLVAWDPRGVGASRPAVSCLTDAESDARNAQPFTRPTNLDRPAWIEDAQMHAAACRERNPGVLPYLSTGNVARDLDLLRAAVGDAKLNYLGYSYGTAIGATYISMFPGHQRALVLDGAVDPKTYFGDPITGGFDQTAAFEDEISRFFARCALQARRCGFGNGDPSAAYDRLVAKLDASPLVGPDGRKLTGDTVRLASVLAMYTPDLWQILAIGLSDVQRGDGGLIQAIADAANGRDENGHYDPSGDAFYSIYAVDGNWPADTPLYESEGRRSVRAFPHFFFNHGYSELQWGELRPVPNGPATGPFRNPADAPTTLVVDTTHDPATPFADGKAMARTLGNSRLLAMDGDGHTASYAANSACVDDAVTAYFVDGTLPAKGTVCQQEKEAFPATSIRSRAVGRALKRVMLTHHG
jgi:pimeloyl-ACP methyl ester carboxylesterase